MTVKAWEIVIPNYTPPLTNAWRGRHWSKRAKPLKAFVEFLNVYGYAVPKVTVDYRPCRSITLLVGTTARRLPDPDGYLKDWLDGMKTARLIVDDAQAWCRWERPVIYKAAKPHTLITLGDV